MTLPHTSAGRDFSAGKDTSCNRPGLLRHRFRHRQERGYSVVRSQFDHGDQSARPRGLMELQAHRRRKRIGCDKDNVAGAGNLLKPQSKVQCRRTAMQLCRSGELRQYLRIICCGCDRDLIRPTAHDFDFETQPKGFSRVPPVLRHIFGCRLSFRPEAVLLLSVPLALTAHRIVISNASCLTPST